MASFLQKIFRKKANDLRYSNLLPTWRTTTDAKWYEWRTDRAIREGLKSSSYVYACVQIIARSVASVPWYVYKQNASGDWLQVENHPLQKLIERPTPWHSRKDLMVGMAQHLYLGGNSVHTKVRANGIVAELWQLQPDWVRVFPSKTDWVDHYQYHKDGIITDISPADIMHNKFNDPSNPYWGLAPLQAGARAVDIDVEAVKFQKVGLQNRAITDGIFTFEHPLTQDQWTEARAMVREQHQGMDNAHTPWVLGAGANWQQMSLSPAEMDFINSRKFTREEICTIFQVPPPMIGIQDRMTYNNIETARKIFWMDTVTPLLEDIKDCFNLSLTPEFGNDIELSYDLGNVEALQESTADKITQAKDLWAMGVPFNMINQKLELGFDDIDGGDTGFLPNSLVPADEMANKVLPPPIDPNKQPLPPNSQDPNAKPPPNAQTDPPQPDKVPPKAISALLTKEQKANAIKGINLKTEQQKDYYTEQVHQQRAKWITNLTRKSAQLFEAEGTAVAKAVKTGDWKKAIDSHKEQWEKFYQASYQAIAIDIGKNTFDNLQKAYTPRYFKAEGDFFDPYDEIITAYIVELAGTKVTWVSDWTKQIIGAMVKENNDNNGTMDDLAKMIKDQYKEFSRYRSYRIARTETQNALGFAQYQAGHQAQEKLGVAIVGEWWTSLDDRVRKSHEKLHGTRAKLGQPFGNGLTFAGQYENDLGGSNNINCRCVILHHLEGEDL